VSINTDNLKVPVDQFLNFYPHRAPHIMWMLGAGASIVAGLPSAGTLTWEFKRAIYCNRQHVSPTRFSDLNDPGFQATVQAFFDSQIGFPKLGDDEEYSFYFERYLSDERDRRRFLDNRLQGVKPSFGHVCFAALHAISQARIAWTTNFDQLVERAMSLDMIAEHLPGGLTVAGLDCPEKAADAIHNERWPICVKMHGDFQYRKLMNTSTELKSQNEVIQKALLGTCNRFGLAVIGYSGRDHSVMDTLRSALEGSSPFPHGLYWFNRFGSRLSTSVIDLLTKAKAKGVDAGYIEIGGFDELMADLFLPHHVRLPNVRDLVKQQRDKRSPATLSYKCVGWPIIRTNALEVSDFPTTCTVFEAAIGGAREVKELVKPHSKRVIAVRKQRGVLAFGKRSELETIFAAHKPTAFDRSSLERHRLRHDDSVEFRLFYHAILQGISNATGLRRSQNLRGRMLFMSSVDAVSDIEKREIARLGGQIARQDTATGAMVHQAVRLSLDFCDQRLWLIVEPTLAVTSDGIAPYSGEDRASIVREELAKRYNKQSNDWLVFWIGYLKSRLGTPMRIGFPDASVDSATVFTLSDVTAFARRS
jgi:hypothetical protein